MTRRRLVELVGDRSADGATDPMVLLGLALIQVCSRCWRVFLGQKGMGCWSCHHLGVAWNMTTRVVVTLYLTDECEVLTDECEFMLRMNVAGYG